MSVFIICTHYYPFHFQSESVVVIQTLQINLTFLVLGLFFLDNSVKNMAQKCTMDNSVESSRQIIVDQLCHS